MAWAGTHASAHDEWIELHNPDDEAINLEGWRLTDGDDLNVSLGGTIGAYGFYLLERTDDSTVADIPADAIYTGSLNNSGERLQLLDPSGSLVDSANSSAGSWPAGESGSRFSMERLGGDDRPGNWSTFPGYGGNGIDASGSVIGGTPRQPNASWFPQPATPSATTTPAPTEEPPSGTAYPPRSVLINEVAWAGTLASSSDEWLELHNTTDSTLDLAGWILSDGQDIEIALSGSIAPYSYYLLERGDDSVVADIGADLIYSGSLRNGGERLTLRDPSGAVIDTADGSDGWPAGDSSSHASMERLGGEDHPGNWVTSIGGQAKAHDKAGNPIQGTPRSINACLLSATVTPSPSPSSLPAPGAILINEIAWSGTLYSASDEWIELRNITDQAIDLNGWILTDGADIDLILNGVIAPNGFFLLERSDDNSILYLQADQIYSGSLSNSGERLELRAPNSVLIDSANHGGGHWPAGDASSRSSMERRGGGDKPANWATFTGYHGIGRDAGGNTIQGTPRSTNSIHFPTPQPTWIPGKVVINEVLIRPHFDWQGTGGVNPDDEFIELYNLGPGDVNLRNWSLDDLPGEGSAPFVLPGRVIHSGGYVVFFRSKTHIALNDTGDTVRLLDPSGGLVDSITYLKVRAANLSYGRLPDGSDRLSYGLWPTPLRSNLLFLEVAQEMRGEPRQVCNASSHPGLRLPRLIRPATHQSGRILAAQIHCPQRFELAMTDPVN